MRLIDADRMKQNIVDDGGHEIAAKLRTWVENQITIEAIPVEWLRAQMNIADDAGDLDSVDLISWLIQTWHQEQEAQI